MNYKFKVFETKYGNFLEMNFTGEGNVNILSSFLNSSNMTVKEYKNKWIEAVENVINKKCNKEKIGVEAFDVDIENKKTTIYFEFAKEDNDSFELSTLEFKDILRIWFDELEKFEKKDI
ncbi:MAG: DUF5376 family protein [Paraclostridium sordellii]|uniref:Uncharacterized protein n=1 Tax=Paraclostridium sordellii TaxID=1505 RepID=A0A9P1P947_PARSO|nr:DUF5376 family protein [Paeniclostridium sordellii]RGX07874.1 hypothetical protein DWV40_09245 [Paeniclostridium sordellii]CEO33170.1 Uncharacterised protein [[Clostridium] sordellii] [Paeniclostridium sordellii]